MNIYLIGYRCSGKTTVGNALAVKTNWLFLDTDEHIFTHYNATITKMVERYGWRYFRAKENEIIEHISHKDQYIVATGGGVVLNHKNIVLMKSSGVLVWLRVKKENVKKWIVKDSKTLKNRPSLSGKDLMNDIEQTFSLRNDIYNSVCDFTVCVDRLDIRSICDHIFCLIPNIL